MSGSKGEKASAAIYSSGTVSRTMSATDQERPQSVDRFVPPGDLARLMTDAGLRDVRVRRVGLGTVTIHVGRAP